MTDTPITAQQVPDLEVFVFKQQAVVDSRDVARAIGRPHWQLIRSIQTYIGHLKHAVSQSKNGLAVDGVKDSHHKNVVADDNHSLSTGRKSVPGTNNKNGVSEESSSDNSFLTQSKNGLSKSTNQRIFAPVNFFIPSTYVDDTGRTLPCYLCTHTGCDLIANKMTGEKGTLFTAAYVSKFRAMETDLAKREAQRAVKAPIRRALTDAIRDSGENERMHGHAFATYTNLIYKAAVGKTATQLRKAGGKDALRNLDAEQLAAVTKREAQVCTLLDCGMTYDAIRAVLEPPGKAVRA